MNSAAAISDNGALVTSLTQWWALAGVDIAVTETPRNWLVREAPIAAQAPAQPYSFTAYSHPDQMAQKAAPEPVAHEPVPMPDDLDGFMAWLADDPDQPEAAFSRTRILPHVVRDAGMLIITDQPTAEDMSAGQLFSGTDRALLSGMMRAVGLDLEQAGMASLLLARPAGGIIAETLTSCAVDRLRHFVGLTNPRAVIILGDRTSSAFQQTNAEMIDSSTLAVNHQGGKVSAMLLPAPFILLKHAERKAAAWA